MLAVNQDQVRARVWEVHVWREERWLEVAVGDVVNARYVDVALGGPEDVLLAVLELGDVVRVIQVVFDNEAPWRGLEPLPQMLNCQAHIIRWLVCPRS